MSFEALGLHASLVQAVADTGYTTPTPVQAQAIPAAIAGRDLLVSSQTGSGKTAAFMLPALNKLANAEETPAGKTAAQEAQAARAKGERVRFKAAQPKMLVLTPTRELALQVSAATEQYTAHMRRLRCVSILGGMPYPKQMQLLAKNPEILVATPGRLIDHMESGKIDFSQLEILVLDEADRMLDMGFIDDIEKIVAATPSARQTMLFSATLDGVVGNMARRITTDPMTIQIASATNRHENISQRVHFVDDLSHKNRLLDHLLRDESMDQAVVFTATKRDADTLMLPHCMATCTRARVIARWTACVAAASRCWSPPTSPRAASTCQASRTSSTTTCRSSRKTTSTASAVPAALAVTVSPSRW
jgi:superfamily II DNA/RNA helicase